MDVNGTARLLGLIEAVSVALEYFESEFLDAPGMACDWSVQESLADAQAAVNDIVAALQVELGVIPTTANEAAAD